MWNKLLVNLEFYQISNLFLAFWLFRCHTRSIGHTFRRDFLETQKKWWHGNPHCCLLSFWSLTSCLVCRIPQLFFPPAEITSFDLHYSWPVDSICPNSSDNTLSFFAFSVCSGNFVSPFPLEFFAVNNSIANLCWAINPKHWHLALFRVVPTVLLENRINAYWNVALWVVSIESNRDNLWLRLADEHP